MSRTESDKPTVVVIGAGNVATHICRRLDGKAEILQIFSRDAANARILAAECGKSQPEITDNPAEITDRADFYIISVKDDAIADVASKLPRPLHGIAVHTSGSAPDDILSSMSDRYGVLYPLQTFSKNKTVDWNPVTVFTHAESDASLEKIDRLAAMLSPRNAHIDFEKRSVLHIAAVFACNFSNYMWTVSDRIVGGIGCGLEVFAPLLEETLRKALANGPRPSQTGPARRGDTALLSRQYDRLTGSDAEIYRLLSNAIMAEYDIPEKI